MDNLLFKRFQRPFLIVIILFLSLNQILALEVKWFGASCLTITDKDTRIIVDPFITRPSFWKVITNQGLFPDANLIEKYFGKGPKKNIILITHTHYDHILDLPAILNLYPNSLVYGPPETLQYLLLHKSPFLEFKAVADGEEISFENFNIHSFKIEHSSLPLGIKFSHGELNKTLLPPLGALDYKARNSNSFVINHPDAKILIHPTSIPRNYHFKEVDLLILGLTGLNIDPLKKELLEKVQAKKTFAIHNDNFFYDFEAPIKKMPFFPTLVEFESKNLPITILENFKD